MDNAYQARKLAQKYIRFLNSRNGQIQQQILYGALLPALPSSKDAIILDAACGTGWLAGKLKQSYLNTFACDSSSELLAYAQSHFPKVEFLLSDLQTNLPYFHNYFDVIILNMAASDITELPKSLKNLRTKLKADGKLILTIPNPSLTYPAAVWKRTLFDFLFRHKPRLMIQNYKGPKKISREFNGQKIPSYNYTLEDYLAAARAAGLKLSKQTGLKSQTDSKKFDLNYQMFRYPLILMLEFAK